MAVGLFRKVQDFLKQVYEAGKQVLPYVSKAATFAAIAMLILAFIYFTYEIMSGKGTNYALYSLITLYNAILYGGKAIKIERCRKLNTFTAIIWGLLTVMLLLGYFNVL